MKLVFVSGAALLLSVTIVYAGNYCAVGTSDPVVERLATRLFEPKLMNCGRYGRVTRDQFKALRKQKKCIYQRDLARLNSEYRGENRDNELDNGRPREIESRGRNTIQDRVASTVSRDGGSGGRVTISADTSTSSSSGSARATVSASAVTSGGSASAGVRTTANSVVR